MFVVLNVWLNIVPNMFLWLEKVFVYDSHLSSVPVCNTSIESCIFVKSVDTSYGFTMLVHACLLADLGNMLGHMLGPHSIRRCWISNSWGFDQAAWPADPRPGKQPSTMHIANSLEIHFLLLLAAILTILEAVSPFCPDVDWTLECWICCRWSLGLIRSSLSFSTKQHLWKNELINWVMCYMIRYCILINLFTN
jgi:hypothetical protein